VGGQYSPVLASDVERIEGIEICEDGDSGAVVVPIGEEPPVGAFDEWLASTHGDGRVELTKPAAELVAEERTEADRRIEGRLRDRS
jgi:hypothetical protein